MGDVITGLVIAGVVIILFALYTFLPELLFHVWHIGTLYHGAPGPRRVALTFDDGPDERYTPEVLQILHDLDVKATFFLVAKRAEVHPELVRLIVEGGHDIGSHSYQHRHHWSRLPFSTWRDIRHGKETLERLSGRPIRFYRPPWGAFNWFTRLACTSLGLTPTLWSARAMDWFPGSYAKEEEDRIVRAAHPGAIVLCHDAGGAEGAPTNTMTALPGAIHRLRQLGFEFATVSQMAQEWADHQKQAHQLYHGYPAPRRALIGLWSVVEFVFARWFHLQGVNEIFRINRTVWHHGPRYAAEGEDAAAGAGSAAAAAAGTGSAGSAGSAGPDSAAAGAGSAGAAAGAGVEAVPGSPARAAAANAGRTPSLIVRDGAPALELHFRNETLIAISSAADHRALVRGLRQAKDGLRDIARMLLYHPDYADIEVIAAPTLMNRGIEMLGFHVEDLPKTRENLRLQRYIRFLMGMYHPEGFRRLREGTRELQMKLVWMTREELAARTGLATKAGGADSEPGSAAERAPERA
ncbi:polysaccharide deacetylase family protein [Alicyclobacillus mengziensis]|uniref:Polysaccharide deacetylase family protein n=1 Tax=Alicyclobacillus mengziensis TaxID=2931921 RepID=A0A9X7VYX7_9BACL|nr:polysaccharide deacetylase family protein [Alicyclobacillus mengziensis]QSO47601.1 polysaccharide deacetylase family protein [Alicyclobacillus mengziensis]